jgi:hypothetical protein
MSVDRCLFHKTPVDGISLWRFEGLFLKFFDPAGIPKELEVDGIGGYTIAKR